MAVAVRSAAAAAVGGFVSAIVSRADPAAAIRPRRRSRPAAKTTGRHGGAGRCPEGPFAFIQAGNPPYPGMEWPIAPRRGARGGFRLGWQAVFKPVGNRPRHYRHEVER